MKSIACLLFFLPLLAWSRSTKELERINFFPNTRAFAILGYQYQITSIDTPHASVNTATVHNYSNALNIAYAYRLKNLFLGVVGQFELGSENGIPYGVPTRERFTSSGFAAPELLVVWRLRQQQAKKGLIDLTLTYSPDLGPREIGGDKVNRLQGRRILRTAISHGLLEEDWEFRSKLEWTYFGEGVNHNNFQDETFFLEPKHHVSFSFNVQHRLSDRDYINALIGVIYREEEDIDSNLGNEREIQAGTGTLFKTGYKRSLNDWQLLGLEYALFRSEYFVKSDDFNLDGTEIEQTISLTFTQAF